MQIFVGKIPLETSLVVWDLFFLKGPRALLRTAITIFQIVESDVVEFERFDEVLMYIQDFVAKDLSPSVLLLEFANEIKKAEFE